jgi:hypothetical protein
MTIDTLLAPTKVWNAKIYSNGWKKPGLGTADVIKKARQIMSAAHRIDVLQHVVPPFDAKALPLHEERTDH